MPMPTAASAAATALALLLFVGPAHAFDCAEARTPVERAICRDKGLRDQDTALAAAYAEVRSYETDDERAMLLQSQKDWIATREEACAGMANDDQVTCVHDETASRLDVLAARPDAGPGTGHRMIPVFVEQAGGPGLYAVDYTLYRFAQPQSAGETLFNQAVAAIAAGAPLGVHADLMDVEGLDASAQLTLSYASARFISALHVHGGYDGGAHPNGGTGNINIDLARGREITFADVFPAAAGHTLAGQCRDQIIDLKKENAADGTYDPAQDPFLRDGVIAAHVGDFRRWTIGETDATVTFDPYEIGPYVEGEYDCTFSMDDLKAMALAGAPLP
jgi:uncharacterized protein YecT (DUF1311 family)